VYLAIVEMLIASAGLIEIGLFRLVVTKVNSELTGMSEAVENEIV
jgi:hypothetical protein